MKTSDAVYVWMTPAPYSIRRDDTIAQAESMLAKHGIRHLPVMDGDDLVGLVSERDLQVGELFAHSKALKVETVMATEPYVVHPATPLAEVADEMAKKREDAAVVIERGRVVGVFTAIDALRAIAKDRGFHAPHQS